MDYSKLSDFEINKTVAEAYGLLVQEMDDSSSMGMTPEFHEKYPTVVWVADLDCSTGQQCEPWWQFDPCNCPADAWPIIVDNCINIEWPAGESCIGTASIFTEGSIDLRVHFANKDNALRAAMVVYLIMRESNLTPLQSPKQGS